MSHSWRDYPGGKEIMTHPSGFIVVRPKNFTPGGRPIFCQLCDSVMKFYYDDVSHKKFECCDKCANAVVYPRLKEWENGWRPPKHPRHIKDKRHI